MKTFDAFKDAIQFLEQTTSQTYLQCKIEAEEIFSYVMEYEKAKLYSDYIPEITERLRIQVKDILKKRKDGIPLSYILKKHKFYKHEFYVDENVLIPRSETESIVEQLLRKGDEIYQKRGKCIFLDAGCGSGCVGITVASERPRWKIILSDFYKTTINVAKKNLGLCNFNNIELICGDWLKPFGNHTLDFIFSNPPYIAINDNRVESSVFKNEPHTALYSGKDGLDALRHIVETSPRALNNDGVLILEFGIDQPKAIISLLELNDFTDISIHMDYNMMPRFASSRKKNG